MSTHTDAHDPFVAEDGDTSPAMTLGRNMRERPYAIQARFASSARP